MPDTLTVPKPGTPTGVSFDVEHAYILYYIKTPNPHTQMKVFCYKAKDLKEVVQRVKDHCSNMNYRFVRVEPFLKDLNYDERYITQKDSLGE